ncbi:MAG: TetR/AcrR family transcriptional regulator [Hydrogenophilus sp.]|nr:TetR/AcrR family transcriptional regulator [Hydrogenophilus sp.]
MNSSRTPSPPRPPRRRRKEARPQELLAAAVSLFVERGYAATHLADVARRAGVAKGTIYRYYRDKLDLFTAVIRHHIAPLLDADALWLAEIAHHPPADRLWALLRRWGERLFHTPHGGMVKLILAEAHNFPAIAQIYHTEIITPARALIEQLLIEGQKQGHFPPSPAAAELTPLLLAPLIHRTILLYSMAAILPDALDPEENFWRSYRWLLFERLLMPPFPPSYPRPQNFDTLSPP